MARRMERIYITVVYTTLSVLAIHTVLGAMGAPTMRKATADILTSGADADLIANSRNNALFSSIPDGKTTLLIISQSTSGTSQQSNSENSESTPAAPSEPEGTSAPPPESTNAEPPGKSTVGQTTRLEQIKEHFCRGQCRPGMVISSVCREYCVRNRAELID